MTSSSCVFAILALSTTPAIVWGAQSEQRAELGGVAKQCHDLAVERIRETKRTYNAARSGWDEKERLFNIWIGPYLFKIPEPYVNDVNGGYPNGVAGINAILVATLPDMKIARAPAAELIDGVSPHVQIWITCDPTGEYATVKHTATRSREDYVRRYLGQAHPLMTLDVPELGLIGYKTSIGATTLYFPKDATIKNAHGGVLAMQCDEPYPPQRVAPRPLCLATFAFRDGVAVDYRFPEHFLRYWRTGYEGVVRLLKSFLVEN